MRTLGGEVTMADVAGGGTACVLTHPLERRARKQS
jgi:hypothetical protein